MGGGPAGLAAAIAARRCGISVTLADPARPGEDKACGEGVLPEGVEALRRLGIRFPAPEVWPFRGIRFLGREVTAEARFSHGYGLAIRRTVLHALLAEHAEASGVRLLWNTPVVEISSRGAMLRDRFVSARWIVGADGGRSRVRRWMRRDPRRPSAFRYAVRRHYRVRPWSDFVEVHWSDDAQFYVSRIAEQEVCVVLISRRKGARIEQALADFPVLAGRLAAAHPSTAARGSLTASLRLSRVSRGPVALAGDASGSVDAITGQGLTLAFLQAEALAAAISTGNLARYEAEHRRIMRRPMFISRLLLSLDGRPRLRRRVLRILAEKPHLFARLLAIHAGAASAAQSVVGGLHLGWSLIAS